MHAPTLYLLIGYPGAGKTKVSRIIAAKTGAVHLWSDYERHKLFPQPTHSEAESVRLYDELNHQTQELLAAGQSVVFDTNFNFYADRRKLRHIADKQGAKTVVIWITIPKALAKERAVHAPVGRNGYNAPMSEKRFEAIVTKLEPPRKDEKTIKIDGANFDSQTVMSLLRKV